MANGDRPPVSLMDRNGGSLSPEDLEDVQIESLPNGLEQTNIPEGIEIVEEEDGGVTLDFDPQLERNGGDFYDNLAEYLSDRQLSQISNDLLDQYQANRNSRQDWEEAYSKGLELLGFTYEERTQPFRGATGVTHPLLAEAAVQFQAQAFNELLPSSGPVRTEVMGLQTTDKIDQAQRVKNFMNYYITNVMEEYTPEFDQMLFYLPLAGSTFKKVFFDEGLGRPVSKFVPAENLVVPFDATGLETCPNITHIVRMPLNELRKQQVSGFYRDIPVLPSQEEATSLTDEIEYIEGVKSSNIDYDCTLIECHVDLDLEGYEEIDENGEETGIKVPYIVTISEDSGKVLGVRRNYGEDDPLKKKNTILCSL
jgi:hypothetical protein